MSASANWYNENVPDELKDLVRPHIDSFDYFLNEGVKTIVEDLPPLEFNHPETDTTVTFWIENVSISKPMKENAANVSETRLFPTECREAGKTYAGKITGTVCSQIGDGEVERHERRMGEIPIMVGSSHCHLRNLNRKGLIRRGEEASEIGGYFVSNGIERVVRLLILPKRHYCQAVRRTANTKRGPSYSQLAAFMRCTRRDQSSITVRLHYLTDGRANLAFSLRKREYFIPAALLLKAFVESSDKEIFERVVGSAGDGKPPTAGEAFASERAQLMLGDTTCRGLHTRMQCLAYLGAHFRDVLDSPSYKTDVAVGEQLLREYIFVHLDKARDKFNALIHMLRKLYSLAAGEACEDNPDSLMHQDILLPGHLMCLAFRERLLDDLLACRENPPSLPEDDLLACREKPPFPTPRTTSSPAGRAPLPYPGATLLRLPGNPLPYPGGRPPRLPHSTNPRASRLLRRIKETLKMNIRMDNKFDITDPAMVKKTMDRVKMEDIMDKLKYTLNTGNLISSSGLDLNQVSGFTIVADKLNFVRYISHFRSVHRGAFFTTLRTTTVRKLLPESW
ncbi:DNA-directed RNA polymerase I subunit RPA2, partial [Cymbomonas tetramitiformis]